MRMFVKQRHILNRLLLKNICILRCLQPSLVQCRNVSSDKHSFFRFIKSVKNRNLSFELNLFPLQIQIKFLSWVHAGCKCFFCRTQLLEHMKICVKPASPSADIYGVINFANTCYTESRVHCLAEIVRPSPFLTNEVFLLSWYNLDVT